jgi:hypothetical protein
MCKWTDPISFQCECVLPVTLIPVAGDLLSAFAVKDASTLGGDDKEKIGLSPKAYFREPTDSERSYSAPGSRRLGNP